MGLKAHIIINRINFEAAIEKALSYLKHVHMLNQPQWMYLHVQNLKV